MTDERAPDSDHPHTSRDILAEIEAEVAHELEEERPPAGGPAYQTVGALVALAIGVGGAVLAYGYGAGLRSGARPGPVAVRPQCGDHRAVADPAGDWPSD